MLTVITDETDGQPKRPTRDQVFELWMFNGRPTVAELLRVVERETGYRFPDQTVRDWYNSGMWDIEADRRLALLAPNMTVRTGLHVIVAASRASSYLEDVWSGRAPFDKRKHDAATSMIAAVGFSPGSKARPALPSPSSSPDTPAATPEEAAARIAARRASRQGTA